MDKSILDQLLYESTYTDFLNFLQNKKHPDPAEIRLFEKYTASGELFTLGTKVADGEYVFGIPRKKELLRPGQEKPRTVYSFSPLENCILKLIGHLLHKYDSIFPENLHSYLTGRSVGTALYPVKKYIRSPQDYYAYKLDIHHYFYSVDRDLMLRCLRTEIDDERLISFFSSILSEEKSILNGVPVPDPEKGIIPGSPVSGFLANLFLKTLDLHFAEDKSVLYTRYADDILILSREPSALEEGKNYVLSYLCDNKLTVNKNKEIFFDKNAPVDFLGFLISKDFIDISPKSTLKINNSVKRHAKMYHRRAYKYLLYRKVDIEKDIENPLTVKTLHKNARLFIRHYDDKFFKITDDSTCWSVYYFPYITRTDTLALIDKNIQNHARFIFTGKYNKKNFSVLPFKELKKLGYRTLVGEYYAQKKQPSK